MKSDFEKKVEAYMCAHAMLTPGEEVTVAVSGGADSVALLLALRDHPLRALHINHQLRGEEADADERFVAELCEDLGVPLAIRRCDVAALAEEAGVGIEEAGRLARHSFYAAFPVVALAHHANDQAETFLFRASRGASVSGLVCMRPTEQLTAADGGSAIRLIRPLLGVSRAEIEAYLRSRGQDWREDASNRDESYARNAIRRSVIPALEEKVNTEAARHLAEAAESIREVSDFLREEAKKRGEGIWRIVPSVSGDEPTDEVVIFDEVLALPKALQGCLILDALYAAAGTRRDFGRLHVEQVRALFDLPVGKRAELPHGIIARREESNVTMGTVVL